MSIAITLAIALVAIETGTSKNSPKREKCMKGLQSVRAQTTGMQRFMGFRPYPVAHQERHVTSCAYLRWMVRFWRKREHGVYRQYSNPPHLSGWLCIHSHEGNWNDPNPPYYGGLQMDYGFQETYGSELLRTKGTADHWTPTEQMWVAERAYRSGRGYYPWPNTARYCGLL